MNTFAFSAHVPNHNRPRRPQFNHSRDPGPFIIIYLLLGGALTIAAMVWANW